MINTEIPSQGSMIKCVGLLKLEKQFDAHSSSPVLRLVA